MAIDSAWIFRICLSITAMLILFADTLGYGGANARSDNSIDNARFVDKSQKGLYNSEIEILFLTLCNTKQFPHIAKKQVSFAKMLLKISSQNGSMTLKSLDVLHTKIAMYS